MMNVKEVIMSIFLFILSNNIVPIFTVIILGFIVGKRFNLNIDTLSKLNFYIYVPLFLFCNLYTTEVTVKMMLIVAYAFSLLIINGGVSFGISKFMKGKREFSSAFQNTVMFYNVGNIGIPLITLVFSSAPFVIQNETPYLNLAITTHVMVMLMQNIATTSYGFFNAGRTKMSWRDSIKKVLYMPAIYAMLLAFLCKLIPYDLTELPVWPALDYIKTGMISIALITLGVQLAKTKFKFTDCRIYLSSMLRLIISPLIAIVLIQVFGFQGITAQVLMISSGLPTAVNTALIAIEYDNCPDYVSQAVLTSTMLSAVFLTFNIYFANILFPI